MPQLPLSPRGQEFEEQIAGVFKACGYYVEKNVHEREEEV